MTKHNRFLDMQEAEQPRYVGPGDLVKVQLFPLDDWREATVLNIHRGLIFCALHDTIYLASGFPLNVIKTLNDQPIAGFRDPEDERIKELETRLNLMDDTHDYLVERCIDLQAQLLNNELCHEEETEDLYNQIAELEAKLASASRWIKELEDDRDRAENNQLTEEQIVLTRRFIGELEAKLEKLEDYTSRLLCILTDGRISKPFTDITVVESTIDDLIDGLTADARTHIAELEAKLADSMRLTDEEIVAIAMHAHRTWHCSPHLTYEEVLMDTLRDRRDSQRKDGEL